MNICSYGEDTLCLLGQSVSELAYNGSDTSGLENPLGWMGQASRFAPLLSACTRKARGGPIQTIAPAFDGLKVFPSLAGLSIARFGLSSFQVCQPAGVSAHRLVRTFLTVRRVTGSHSMLRFHLYLWSPAPFGWDLKA
jgi:hypothetical protein